MTNPQYKSFTKQLKIFFHKSAQSFPIISSPRKSYLGINLANTNTHFNKNYFSSKKQNIPEKKQVKISFNQNLSIQESQFLWKLNVLFNIASIGAGFYFPKEAVMFVLTSNSLLQVYQSSKLINRLKEITQKSTNFSQEQMNDSIVEVKSTLKKIVISTVVLLASSVTIAMGVVYPSFTDYSLIGLNFWVLYNLKFNNLAQGYYIALLVLIAFQYCYFQKIFESNKAAISSSKIV